jgi:hypothetical protein
MYAEARRFCCFLLTNLCVVFPGAHHLLHSLHLLPWLHSSFLILILLTVQQEYLTTVLIHGVDCEQ